MGLIEGTIVDEVWVIERALGSGGMGSVYRAHNLHAPKIIAAIKMLGPEFLRHQEAKSRFIREAEILHALDHPHIVKVRNIRLDHVPPYMEMEFIEGTSLYDVLREGPMPLETTLLVAEQFISALRYLHRRGVYHRDLKPANLLLRKRSVLKVVDFGLAVDVAGSERITDEGAHFGTVAYAPPEWIRPQEMDPRLWDLYAYGLILYEMLSGKTPFVADDGATSRQAAVQIMARKQQLPCLDPGRSVPSPLRQLVRDLTALHPSDRIQDAHEVLRRLLAAQDELSIDAGDVLLVSLQGDELRQAVSHRAQELEREQTDEELAPTAPRIDRQAVGVQGPPSRPEVRQGLQFLAAALGGLGLVAFFAAFTMIGIKRWRAWSAPEPREVVLTLAGVPRGTPVGARLEGRAPDRHDGLALAFDGVYPGPREVRWAAGPGCNADDCPGTGCPDTCATGTASLDVPQGRGAARLPVEVALPEPRPVRLPFPDAPDGTRLRLDELVVDVVDGAADLAEVAPGDHVLRLWAGDCPDAQGPCTPGDDCPPGCSVAEASLHVPANGRLLPPALALAMPEAPPPPAPAPAPSRGASGPIDRTAFAAWLGTHPEWAPAAAIASGLADGSYLQGIDLGAPDARPVVSVPWAAAQAFCSGRGGLPAVEAAPLQWAEGATGLFQEWRVQGGAPAWRRYDGAASTQASTRDANAFTGFRCAR